MVIPAFAQESTLDNATNQLEKQIIQDNLETLDSKILDIEDKMKETIILSDEIQNQNFELNQRIEKMEKNYEVLSDVSNTFGANTPTWIIAFATLIASFVTVAAFVRQNKNAKIQNDIAIEQNLVSKQNIEYQGILEIMKIFNDDKNAEKRNTLYEMLRKNTLYLDNGEFASKELQYIGASVRGTFDVFGKLIKDNYVNKEQFLSMYCGSVIRMYKVLRKHIETQRQTRGENHLAENFEQIFNDSITYWKNHFPDAPEPEPY